MLPNGSFYCTVASATRYTEKEDAIWNNSETAVFFLQTDANSQCAKVQPHGGKMQTCLKEHRALLTWDCQEQLFRQEVENADDLRLSVRLFKVCLADKKKVSPCRASSQIGITLGEV